MAKPAPNKRITAIVLSVAFVVVTLLMGVLASINDNPYEEDKPSSEVQVMAPEEQSPESEGESSSQELLPEESSLEETSSEEQAAPPEETEAPVYYNVPDEMRAVMLVAGRDFLIAPTDTARATLAAQIDKALNDAKELTMNTIIVDTKYNDAVLFTSDFLPMAQVELDCVDYIVTKARELGFYVYATYDVNDQMDSSGSYRRASSADGETLDAVSESIGAFAEKYQLDGILLNNYYNVADAGSYAQYNKAGGGIGYHNYLRQVPRALVTAAVNSVREHAPGTQVGLLAEAVWENAQANPEGSETKAPFTALGNGNADTRAFVQSGLFDFVMVQNFGSTNEQTARFGVVANWWAQIARDANVTLYIMHASDRVGIQSTGWTVYEQLTKQVIDLEEISGISGSAFNSLKALLANPGNSTTTLVQYMNDQVDQAWVLEQLAVTKPAQMTYKTKEPTVTFQGASQPGVDVTINGEKIPTNESGYFTIREDLKEGLNTFAISHKGKTFTYNITREIIVLKEIQPTGSISVDGGMEVTITAMAYAGSTVSATINGQTINLSPTDSGDSEEDRDSSYQRYTGVFTAPSASSSAIQLGAISVTARSADGVSKTLQGASVTVNKKAKMGDGVVVQVTADQAETFPINTLNDKSSPGYFPLPKGTVDKTYGDEIIYKDGKTQHSYWKLESGLRVYAADITTGGQMPDNNQISRMSVKSSGAYTTITLTTGSKIPYKVEYDGSRLVFQFEYTSSVPQSQEFDSSNALFKSAQWSGSNLTLQLKKAGGFIGYKAYYEDGNQLVLRFNNSPGSLSGARIVVDPGHGGNDPGALGFYPGKDEADINLAISKKLVSELKSRGASVLMVNPGSTMASRMAAARAFNPQVLISIHNNTSGNAAARGTEIYYFYPFQKQLAQTISSNVSQALGTENRGAKQGLYYMTRESQFACVLAEIGFMSNEAEYTKLINSKHQTRIAQALANAVNGYLGGVNSGGGTQGGDEEDEQADGEISDISLNQKVLNLEKGEEYALKATVEGSSDGARMSWKSDDTNIATVNQSGKVVAKNNGTTYITVTTEEGGYVAECEVRVGKSQQENTEGITLGRDEVKLSIGQTYTLSARVNTSGSDILRWETSDEAVATVSSSGKITAVGEGNTWITVKTRDGKYSADCEIIVGKRDNSGGLINKITISGENKISVGTRTDLTAEVAPYNASDPGVKWFSSNNEIAKLSNVTESSVKVEGLRDGTATITAQAYDDGKVEATFKITVGTGVDKGSDNKNESSNQVTPRPGVLVEEITISGNSTLTKGTRQDYTAKVSPNDAADPGVKWEVSDSNILMLSGVTESSVKVEGLRTGTAYLVATAYDENKAFKKFKITVR